ncbi:MAG: hypothetical protein WCX17_00670 [Parcubacteria group bacterium]|jgi:hypothetical protein
MNKYSRLKILFFAIIFCGTFKLAENSLAAPAVTGVSGTVEHGQNITITGTEFGTKSTAAPWKFDDFSGGANGQTLNEYTNGWSTSITSPLCGDPWPDHNCIPVYSNSIIRPNTTMSLLSRFPTVYQGPYDSQFWITSDEPFSDVYIDYYLYADTDSPYARNMKFFRLLSERYDAHLAPYFDSYYVSYRTSAELTTDNTSANNPGACSTSSGGNGVVKNLPYIADTSNNWIHVQILNRLNTPGTADGTMQMWVNGVNYKDVANYCIREADNTDAWKTLGLGKEWYQDTVGDSGSDNYWSNVYVDKTPARVMLCNNSNFSSATICEPQIPSGWGATSITTAVNIGDLPSTGTAYLFVFDADNNHNATGYPVTLGAMPDTTPPASPTGLSVN